MLRKKKKKAKRTAKPTPHRPSPTHVAPAAPSSAQTLLSKKTSPTFAIFSDIHSNLEALEAVLVDMKQQGVTQWFCLGDIVGYNANPYECLQKIQALGGPIVQGNHDREGSCESSLSIYRHLAKVSMEHTRSQLPSDAKHFLQKLPLALDLEGFTLVHSSLCEPEAFYYIDSPLEASLHFDHQTQPLCFYGHTHLAHVYTWKNYTKDGGCPSRLHLEKGTRYLINVGSVGQPRDEDWRASYVLYRPELQEIEFRRVEYPLEKTQKKIRDAGLPLALAERLAIGA